MIHDLKQQGLSNTAIARQLGISRRTVTRRLQQGLEVPVYGPRPPQPRLIGPFEAYRRDRVTAWPDLSAKRLFREIKEQGYRGGYSAVTAFLREVRPPSVQLYERRYETPPGHQAQVDFAYFEVAFTDAPGVIQIVWLFTMVLGYSRFPWGRFCPNQKLPTVLRCHIDAFADLGGVPKEVLYDRMKTAVVGTDLDDLVVYNPSLVALANHYGYQPRACRPYRARTKGKVERPYRYVRQDFFLARAFNLDDLNVQFEVWLAEIANPRRYATTRRIVAEAFAEEHLQPLPAFPYSAAITVERRISRDGMVSVDGNLYSVPDSTRRRTVEVQIYPKEIRIFEAGQRIACHPVLPGKHQSRLDPSHRQAPPRHTRRSRSIPVRSAASAGGPWRFTTPLPSAWLVRPCDDRDPGSHPAHLVGLRMPRALEALDHTVQRIEKGELSALEAIDALLAEELSLRESRRIGVAMATARLTPPKTLESFDFSFQPRLDRGRIMALAQLDFVARAEVVHFLGPPGTGKSHLATALGVAAVKAGKSVYRCTLAELIESLTRAEREGRLIEKIRFHSRAALLIIDEIGYLPVTTGGANLFFQLVNARYEKGAMILTSNRGFAEWGEVFGNPVVATALLDCLLHHAVVVQIEGASYRLRAHADLIPEHARANAPITPPPPPRRRGRPPKTGALAHHAG